MYYNIEHIEVLYKLFEQTYSVQCACFLCKKCSIIYILGKHAESILRKSIKHNNDISSTISIPLAWAEKYGKWRTILGTLGLIGWKYWRNGRGAEMENQMESKELIVKSET